MKYSRRNIIKGQDKVIKVSMMHIHGSGLVKRGAQLPELDISPSLMFVSINGASTNPRIVGVIGKSYFSIRDPITPNARSAHTSNITLLTA